MFLAATQSVYQLFLSAPSISSFSFYQLLHHLSILLQLSHLTYSFHVASQTPLPHYVPPLCTDSTMYWLVWHQLSLTSIVTHLSWSLGTCHNSYASLERFCPLFYSHHYWPQHQLSRITSHGVSDSPSSSQLAVQPLARHFVSYKCVAPSTVSHFSSKLQPQNTHTVVSSPSLLHKDSQTCILSNMNFSSLSTNRLVYLIPVVCTTCQSPHDLPTISPRTRSLIWPALLLHLHQRISISSSIILSYASLCIALPSTHQLHNVPRLAPSVHCLTVAYNLQPYVAPPSLRRFITTQISQATLQPFLPFPRHQNLQLPFALFASPNFPFLRSLVCS